jgi:hypothetical protein
MNRFLERVFKVDAFKKHHMARMAEFGRTIFQAGRSAHQVDELAVALRPPVEEESTENLAAFNKAAAGEPLWGLPRHRADKGVLEDPN